MIENILKKKPRTFRYGAVDDIKTVDGKVRVKMGERSIWIKSALSLNIGSVIILARNEDSSWFIIQDSGKALPSQGELLLV